jgi:hypothetical protein
MPALLSRPASRIAQGSTALLLAFGVVIAPASGVRAGGPPTTTDPALAAAGWLAGQVQTDPTLGAGTLADAIFAFAAVGAGQSAAATALSGMEANLDAYVAPGGTLAPGALAKAMLAVQVQGGDPTAFGGRDLEADLRGLLAGGGADDGRFGTGSVLDQALAIVALSRTAGGVPASAVTWLSEAQCPSGEFVWDSSCPAAPGSEDPDTTAIALQALLAVDATAAADAATAWLLSIQLPGGGLPSFGLANTNSSGVGGQALRAAGETAAADAAAGFVLSLRFGCDADPAEIGAIGWAEGIPGFLVFSTPQAVLALGAPALDQLTSAGAEDEAPILNCPVAAPAPSEPAASVPPTAVIPSGSGELPNTAATGATDWRAAIGAVLLAAAAAAFMRPKARRAAA